MSDPSRPLAAPRRASNGPRKVEVPRVLHIAPRALDDLPTLLEENFDTSEVVVVTGASASWAISGALRGALADHGAEVREFRDPKGETASVTQLVEALDQRPASLILAVGGGRPIDVAKLASSRTRVDLVVVPTILSHDGMCSPVASLVAGDKRRRSLPAATPAGVVVDTTLLGDAPLHYLRAGVGDLLSNITAISDWRLAADDGDERVDELAASMALAAAQSVLEVDWPPTQHDIETIARGLVMSGLAMEIAGSSRPCSGAEHLISHALDELFPSSRRLHGEQVALGTVLASHAHDHPARGRIMALLDRMSFPRDLVTWGWDREQVVDAIAHAPLTRPARRTILDSYRGDRDAAARLLTDAVG